MVAASCGRNEAVSNKKIKSTENKSTIGVMSIWGDRTGAFILGMEFCINNDDQPNDLVHDDQPKTNYLVVAANDCTRLNPASSIL